MKKCPFCGADIEDSARFCLYCMQSLVEKEEILLHEEKKKPQWLRIIAAVVAVLFVLMLVFSGKHTAPEKTLLQENQQLSSTPTSEPTGTEEPLTTVPGTLPTDPTSESEPPPSATQPASPSFRWPSLPGVTQTTMPGITQTTQPGNTQTTQPETLQSTQPDTKPESNQPTKPESNQPAEPEVTQPTQPKPTKPAEPSVTQPTKPKPTQPALPEVTQPTQPEQTQPAVPETTQPTTEPHEHSFTVKNAISKYLQSDATCTQPARYVYSCSCGEKGSDTFYWGESLGHTIVKEVGYPADCVNAGLSDREYCSVCDVTFMPHRELPPLEHTIALGDPTGTCLVCGGKGTITINAPSFPLNFNDTCQIDGGTYRLITYKNESLGTYHYVVEFTFNYTNISSQILRFGPDVSLEGVVQATCTFYGSLQPNQSGVFKASAQIWDPNIAYTLVFR